MTQISTFSDFLTDDDDTDGLGQEYLNCDFYDQLKVLSHISFRCIKVVYIRKAKKPPKRNILTQEIIRYKTLYSIQYIFIVDNYQKLHTLI